MTTSSERSVWGTRLGFILASAGSAVGLGAIWKFPYMAGTNGGSAFILPYIVLTIAIGFIVLMIEMASGWRCPCIKTFRRPLLGRRWENQRINRFFNPGVLSGYWRLVS